MKRRVLTIGVTMALASSTLFGNTATAELWHWVADIYDGSCPEIGNIAATLVSVSGLSIRDEVATSMRDVGQGAAIPIEASITPAVPLAYTELFPSPHSIVVHGGPARSGSIKHDILCGDIGGSETSPTDIAIGLGGLNDSGWTGIATIHDNGDSTVRVAVYMTTGVPTVPSTETGDQASPEPSPSPEAG